MGYLYCDPIGSRDRNFEVTRVGGLTSVDSPCVRTIVGRTFNRILDQMSQEDAAGLWRMLVTTLFTASCSGKHTTARIGRTSFT